MINLSNQTKKELRQILVKEIGIESVDMLTETNLNEIGLFFLTIFAESLKMKNNEKGI